MSWKSAYSPVLPIPVSFEALTMGVPLWSMVRYLVSKKLESVRYARWKPAIIRFDFDPAVIRFDSIPACGRQTDGQTDTPLIANSRMLVAGARQKFLGDYFLARSVLRHFDKRQFHWWTCSQAAATKLSYWFDSIWLTKGNLIVSWQYYWRRHN